MHLIQEEIGLPKFEEKKLGPNHILFTIAPLPQGYGLTLGNALRRILISSLPGAAASSMKIKGVSHEYSALKGVKNTVLDILLNLKQLELKKDTKGSSVLKLKKTGPGDVLAKDFDCPGEIKILNPDLYITSLDNKSATLEMEVTVEKGVGYRPSKLVKHEEANLIQIDSNFSPLKRIRYDVENTRVGEVTNLDKLLLEIETNGAISPQDALKFAANILKSYYELFDVMGAMPEKDFMSDFQSIMTKSSQEEPAGPSQENYTPIEILGLSPRTLNALINGGIGSIEQLQKCSESKLNNLRGFGKKALTEVMDAMKARGMILDALQKE